MLIFVGNLIHSIVSKSMLENYCKVHFSKGLVTQGLEYAPDKRGVSSSNLLEPIHQNFSY